jgi:hypothetical protein
MLLQIVELPLSHRYTEHLFEAEGLGAELHPVHILFLVLATLELDGHGFGHLAISREIQLDEVALADQTPLRRAHRHTEFLSEEPSRFVMLDIDSFMQDFTLGGESIFFPELLYMDEGELSLAEQRMLEG